MRLDGPPEQTSGSTPVRLLRRAVRRFVVRLFTTRAGTRLIDLAMEDDAVLARTLNRLSDHVAADSDVERSAPAELVRPSDFADCYWLLSPNVVDHGCARLMADEAAYLWSLVRSLDDPQVAEIGRFHGGTCFLLAAAGGRVLSVDNDPKLAPYDRKLANVLRRCGLAERVDLRCADSRTFETAHESLDVVFLDGDHSYDGARADVERWWPAVRVGGHLVMHDGKWPSPSRPWASPWNIGGSCQVAMELRTRGDVIDVAAPGTLVHVVKRA